MRNLECTPTEVNSLKHWYKVRSPFRVVLNFILIWISKWMPSLAVKRGIFRLLGVKVGKDVSIGLGVQLDVFFPELVELGDNTIIGYNTTILTHEFLVEEFRKGRTVIGKNVLIGANCTILAGVNIGDCSKVSSMSLVNRDLEPGFFGGGVPVKPIKRD